MLNRVGDDLVRQQAKWHSYVHRQHQRLDFGYKRDRYESQRGQALRQLTQEGTELDSAEVWRAVELLLEAAQCLNALPKSLSGVMMFSDRAFVS